MSLDADTVVARRRLRRRLILWRVIAVIAVAAFIIALAGRFGGWRDGDSFIARVTVDGLIIDQPFRDAALKKLAKNESAKAVMVRVNSPGGTVVGGENLYRSLRAISETKPVVIVMGEVATSAAYMTAIGGDWIYARAGSVTGSIGVLMQTADVTGLLDKLGITPHSVKSAPLKATPNPLEPFTPEARAAAETVVLDLYDMFVDMVAERRGMDRAEVLKLADGRVYTGRQALENGLIDALGGEPEAREWLTKTREIGADLPVRNVPIEPEDELWHALVPDSLGKVLFSERLNLDGLISLWHPEL